MFISVKEEGKDDSSAIRFTVNADIGIELKPIKRYFRDVHVLKYLATDCNRWTG
jgi:hypothetical protein